MSQKEMMMMMITGSPLNVASRAEAWVAPGPVLRVAQEVKFHVMSRDRFNRRSAAVEK